MMVRQTENILEKTMAGLYIDNGIPSSDPMIGKNNNISQ